MLHKSNFEKNETETREFYEEDITNTIDQSAPPWKTHTQPTGHITSYILNDDVFDRKLVAFIVSIHKLQLLLR